MVVKPTFGIRDMKMSDADVVAQVGFQAWKSSRVHESWYLEDVEARVAASFRTFARKPDAEVIVASVADDGIVGWGARDSRDHPGDRSRAWDYISDLWIAPSFQNKGLGSALIRELLDRMHAESLTVAVIETDVSNTAALFLYQRLGFAEVWRGAGFSPSLGLDQNKVRLEKILA